MEKMTEIKTEKQDEVHFIMVKGEIDAGSSIHLDNAIKDAADKDEKKIAIDLSELSYISSAGLGVFISHLDEFESIEVNMVLFGVNESVKEVFSILGLEKLLTITETKEEAIDSLNG